MFYQLQENVEILNCCNVTTKCIVFPLWLARCESSKMTAKRTDTAAAMGKFCSFPVSR